MCACVTHPIADAGKFESREPDARFVIEGEYLGGRRWLQLPVHPGVWLGVLSARPGLHGWSLLFDWWKYLQRRLLPRWELLLPGPGYWGICVLSK